MSTRPTQDDSAHSDHGNPAKPDPKPLPGSELSSRLSKQWKLAQIMAHVSCFSCFIVSTRTFWTSAYRNCDNESPYGRAYRAGLYSGVTCVFAHTLAYGTWSDSRMIETKAFLTREAKYRRVIRMPIVVQMAAFLQAVAAGMNGLAAYRTLYTLNESRLVPLVAAIAVVSCLVAGIYNFVVANEIRNALQMAISENSQTDPKTLQVEGPDVSASPLVYDTTLEHLRNLSRFEKQWLLVHVLSVVSLAYMHLTGTILLWTTTCASDARQHLLSLAKATQNNNSSWVAATFMAMTVFSSRTGCLQPKTGLELPRWMLVLSQTIFMAEGFDLGAAAYANSGPWFTLRLLRLQTSFTAGIFLVCSVFDFVLMLKPKRKSSMAQDATTNGSMGK